MFMSRNEMEKYVRLVNDLQTDLVVVVGDFVNGQVDEVYPFAEAFSNLKAPFGIYGVMGNHDFYTRDPELIAKKVDDCGVKLLRNDKTIIRSGDGAICLIGIDDTGIGSKAKSMMATAMKNAPTTIPKILLCHRPYFLPQASQSGIDLMLSGHTHGGQVVLGRFGSTTVAPASLASKYIWGKYREGNTSMYVSRGIGTVGLPFRINCPPEITRLILRSGSSSHPG
jgi:predicted MPP superfamily phosphohydrolase